MFGNHKIAKNRKSYECKFCDYNTSNKSDYEKHIQTIKHKTNSLAINVNDLAINLSQKSQNNLFTCQNCNKTYKDNSGLWKHKKKCCNKTNDTNTINKDLIMLLIKENSEFKNMIIKVLDNGTHNTTNNTNNSNNNFNLNVYLNETCKNAMNITDFISQLPVNLTNLEDTGRLGFAEGISKIFIDGLKQINVTDRPLHCSDSKREILYIKNNNEWNKETDNKTILTNAIKHVANNNIKQIFEWTKKYPDYNDYRSRKNDKYLQIVSQSMSGSTEEESNKNYSKIIKNIVRESIIHK